MVADRYEKSPGQWRSDVQKAPRQRQMGVFRNSHTILTGEAGEISPSLIIKSLQSHSPTLTLELEMYNPSHNESI